jgi:queuosine precursor transporter
MRHYKYFSIITGIFCACLVISNILDSKIFSIFSFTLPTGVLIFPITYLFGDVLCEVYGFANSRKVIWTGFFSLLLLVVCLKIAQILPAHPMWNHQESFDLILGKVPRIVAASIVAYFFGEFANSFTVAKLKILQNGKKMSLRFVLSTLVGQGVDTIIFVLIAFAGIMPFSELLKIILSAWAFKVAWEIIALPITIPIVKWLKKTENVDYFDTNTNFSPFTLK